MRNTLLRWRVAAQTALIVLGIIAAKLVTAAFSWELIDSARSSRAWWPGACSCSG